MMSAPVEHASGVSRQVFSIDGNYLDRLRDDGLQYCFEQALLAAKVALDRLLVALEDFSNAIDTCTGYPVCRNLSHRSFSRRRPVSSGFLIVVSLL